MIESIHFKNFKALRDTTLPLSPCTILVGPNGSGKSTVLQALEAVRARPDPLFDQVVTASVRDDMQVKSVQVSLKWGEPHVGTEPLFQWNLIPPSGLNKFASVLKQGYILRPGARQAAATFQCHAESSE